MYELSNFDHVLGVMSQSRVSGGKRTHDPYANSLVHYSLDYQGTPKVMLLSKILHNFLLILQNNFHHSDNSSKELR